MNDTADIKAGGNRMMIFGILAIILGMFCFMAPGLTGLSVITIVGVLVLAAGIVRIIWAFSAGTLSHGMWAFVMGGLMMLCGAVLLANPLLASGILTILLAAYFIADGIAEIAAGLRMKTVPGSGWLLFSGIVSFILGLMIWRQYPLSGVYAIGILLGIKLVFSGLIMITGGSVVRAAVKSAS